MEDGGMEEEAPPPTYMAATKGEVVTVSTDLKIYRRVSADTANKQTHLSKPGLSYTRCGCGAGVPEPWGWGSLE